MTQLFLRTTDKDGKAYGGFQWPLEVGATVTAPDWKPTKECGNGLHGILDGLGDSSHLNFSDDAIWWIVEAADAIDLNGKHKFSSCRVVAFGPRHEVTAKLHELRPGPIHGLCLTGGDRAKLTGGDRATLTGGDWATLTGGDRATLIFLRWIDGRHRVLTAYVGEDGIQPGVPYKASDDFKKVIPA
jgi:hypothetical protein